MKEYRQCKRCLLDTTVSDIIFDENGYCNYCTEFWEKWESGSFKPKLSLEELVNMVKKAGKGKKYDCVVGISGGVDSSYTLVKVVELGLRPLAVHMDNGWDSELATNNIKNLVDKLGVDLYTHVINWDEYRGLMQAFFDADVIDIELLYDNAMLKVNYEQASSFNVRYILAGTNKATEGLKMPKNWNWFKFDKKNIKALAKISGVKIKTFPAIGVIDYYYYEYIKKIRWISFLDFLPEYNKNKALDLLISKFNYKPYPYKHYESVFTRFYQGYILPKKFNVDKRKLHLSNLILTNQITREDALNELKGIAYPDQRSLNDDIEFFLKKMKWTHNDLENYLNRPGKPHSIYGTESNLWNFLNKIINKIGAIKRFLKSKS